MAEEEHLLKEVDSYSSSDGTVSEHWDIEASENEKVYHKSFFSRFRGVLSSSFLKIRSKGRLDPLYKYGVHALPSFLQTAKPNQAKPKALRKTASLDGLRGVSALIVVVYHFFGYFVNVNVGYVTAYPPSMTFWNLPFIKYFINGSAAVHVFFVISGYILSLRSLQQMKKRDMEGVIKTLSSSTFRRSMRLLLPITISMFVEALAIQAGLFDHARANPQLGQFCPPKAASLLAKLTDLKYNIQRHANLFDWSDYHNTNFDDNLWTIGFEYRCSIAVFLLLLAVCRVQKPWIRRSLVIGLAAVYRPYARWDVILFMIGMLLADFDAWSSDSETVSGKHQPFWALVTLVGMFLCSSPMNAADTSLGHGIMNTVGSYVYPWFPYRFGWSVGAGCMVAGAMHSIHTRWVLETKFIQYLGRVSYMLYVVHGPLLRSLGFTIVPWIWSGISSNVAGVPSNYTLGVILGIFIWLPIVFWVADICTRLIDDNCVSLARWIEDKCTSV